MAPTFLVKSQVQENDMFTIHFDDGDVESSEKNRKPDSEAMIDYVDQISAEEQELIESFAVFDEGNTGTIHARKLFQILTEMGDPLDTKEAEELFVEMGISLDSELNYKDLAKIMVQPFAPKPEVVMTDAKIGWQTKWLRYGHKMRCRINTTEISKSVMTIRPLLVLKQETQYMLLAQLVGTEPIQ